MRSCYLGYGHRSGIDDAANNAAHLTAGYATRNATDHATHAGTRRSFVFLDHCDLLRNRGRRTELTVIQFALHLHDLRSAVRGRWRWRRRWRRRSHQERHQLLLGKCFRVDQRYQNENADQKYLEKKRQCRRPGTPFRHPASRFQKAVFKHKPVLRLTVYLDTDAERFAPRFESSPQKIPRTGVQAILPAFSITQYAERASAEDARREGDCFALYAFTFARSLRASEPAGGVTDPLFARQSW